MKSLHSLPLAIAMALGMAVPASAEFFTTAAEVRPMLEARKSGWVYVQEFDGKDLLYFTNLLTWRCGLDAIHYSVNGGAESRLDGEPCYDGEAVPNAQKDAGMLPFVSFPLGSIEQVDVRITYDDGGTDSASYTRGDILSQ